MIVIEPPPASSKAGRSSLNERELRDFLALAKAAIPLRGTVAVLLTSDSAVRDLNRRFRGKDKATDVLSFAPAAGEGPPARSRRVAGDLAISLETAACQARDFGHAVDVEVKILILHGLLHLAGLDHEKDSGEMAAREQELRANFGLPLGLIQRSLRGQSTSRAKPPKTASSRQGKPL